MYHITVVVCPCCIESRGRASGGGQSLNRPEKKKTKKKRKKERKHNIPLWLVLVQLLILVYPPPYILSVFLSPLPLLTSWDHLFQSQISKHRIRPTAS